MARIAAIGTVEHDTILTLDRFPASGGWATILDAVESFGGTGGNTAVALARLGERVTLRTVLGTDAHGDAADRHLRDAGVDATVTRRDGPTGTCTILLDKATGERTVLWRPGASIRKGDTLDIGGLFGHDVVVLDVTDAPLRRFLTDLPAHTRPDVRLLGPLSSIVDDAEPDAIEVAIRFDVLSGTADQYAALLGTGSVDATVADLQRCMPGANLRTAFITLGADGCRWVTRTETGHAAALPVDAVDTTGAGDAFVAGVAWALARRQLPPDTARFANAVAALATRAVGAQASLPDLAEVQAALAE